MDARTEKALRESIVKWEKNARVRKIENAKVGGHDCPLCLIFCKLQDDMCAGCPVREHTGKSNCFDTPYYAAKAKYDKGNLTAFREAALHEVDFLKSLLPEAKSS